MNKKWYYLIGVLLGSVIITSIVVPIVIIYFPKDSVPNNDLIEHEPITILKDEDFENYNFQGNGTENNPYLIENYNITTKEQYSIYIISTTKFLIIRNCYLEASYIGIHIDNITYGTAKITQNFCNNTYMGIFLNTSSGVSITDNICINNYCGIWVEESSETILINNTCNNNGYGIRVSHSSYASLLNNTCNNNYDTGIRLGSTNATLIDNTCNNNFYGIHVGVNNAILSDNICSNNTGYGILVTQSNNITLTNNIFYGCGLRIVNLDKDSYFSHLVENNRVNDKKLGYFVSSTKTSITNPEYGQIILINCTEMIISNQELSNATIGLTLEYCENSTLINNTCCNNYYYGILLSYSNNTSLTKNTCSNNIEYGIFLIFSSNASLLNNTCNNNKVSIRLFSSPNAVLINNNCTNNVGSISLSYSSNVKLINNTCSNNNRYGIWLADNSDNITLANNTLNYNNFIGIYLEKSSNSLIIFNSFIENTEYGIFILGYSDNNTIHHNSFIDNNLGGTSQAWDRGLNNIWYDNLTSEGNYWSDWTGVGDYHISGNAVDPYPLSNPPVT